MLQKIESLRKKPKHIRNRYAFGVAASITLIVALVWGVSLPSRFSEQSSVATKKSAEQTTAFTDELSEMAALISTGINQIKTQAEIVGSGVGSTTETGGEGVPQLEESLSSTTTVNAAKKDTGRVVLIEARSSTATHSSSTQ